MARRAIRQNKDEKATLTSRAAAPRRTVPGAEAVNLDQVIHERVRLAIVSALAVNESLSFNDLKGLLDITDGNLSVHARKLEDAGYVRCSKSFVGRQPRTEYKLTATGRRALEAYLEQMESVIRSARQG
ncbi:MAG TPA: transcriptional regulator [Terriglobales bacterium]|nr:transcriptional regulator [Terriglobales bacterium]